LFSTTDPGPSASWGSTFTSAPENDLGFQCQRDPGGPTVWCGVDAGYAFEGDRYLIWIVGINSPTTDIAWPGPTFSGQNCSLCTQVNSYTDSNVALTWDNTYSNQAYENCLVVVIQVETTGNDTYLKIDPGAGSHPFWDKYSYMITLINPAFDIL